MAVDNLMKNLEYIPYYEEFSKYKISLIGEYMESDLDTFKRCLTGTMTAIAKDEKLETFYKELMRFDDD